MSVINEINSIRDVLLTVYPSPTVVHRQDVPTTPTANSFVVRLMNDTTDTETRFSTRSEREYQIVYFGSSSVDVLTKIETLSRKFLNKNAVIPIKGSLRYMRVEGFSFGMPFKSSSGVDAVIGVMQTTTRTARDQDQYEKMAEVSFDTYPQSNTNTWEVLDGSYTTKKATDGFTFDALESGQSVFDNPDKPNEPFTWDDIEAGHHIIDKE
jgi:hypothetical protein